MPLSAADTQPRSCGRSLAAWAFGALLVCASAPVAAQTVGDVVHVQGIASAQKPGEAARFLQKGDALNQGDVINTAGRGYAVVELKDGSKMTLRPDTTFAISEYRQGTANDGMLLRLLKGGMRAVTGLLAKRNPQSVRINAATATIGIRGTSFDARLCGTECAQEGRQGDKPAVSLAQQEAIVARIAVAFGGVSLVGADGQARPAVKGAPLASGESVRTLKDAYAVVAFRDRTVVTVIAESEFKLENVRFSVAQPASDNFLVRIVKGGARALTGALGKRDPKAVRFNIGTATIGIRGTGADSRLALDCVAGSCNEAAFVYTWEGAVSLDVGDRSVLVEKDRAAVHNAARDRLQLLDKVPEFFITETAPRPDTLQVDFDNLFGTASIEGSPAGLYVLMRDGHIELSSPAGSIDLGPGDTGYLGEGRPPVRLTVTPTFMLFDPVPLPDKFDPNSVRLIDLLNMGGKPGDLICEI
jgi:hypothetical protein